MKLCINCKHYKEPECTNKANVRKTSPVSGIEFAELSPDTLRSYETRPTTGAELCGPSAKWFEPKLA